MGFKTTLVKHDDISIEDVILHHNESINKLTEIVKDHDEDIFQTKEELSDFGYQIKTMKIDLKVFSVLSIVSMLSIVFLGIWVVLNV